jgi:thiol:disulfide interchange protein
MVIMGYKIYLYSSAVFFLLMVATGIWALVSERTELVIWVVGLFILAMITIQMARRSAKKEVETAIKRMKEAAEGASNVKLSVPEETKQLIEEVKKKRVKKSI